MSKILEYSITILSYLNIGVKSQGFFFQEARKENKLQIYISILNPDFKIYIHIIFGIL